MILNIKKEADCYSDNIPLYVIYQYLKATDNAENFSLGEFKDGKISRYSMLMINETKETKGILRLAERNAPQNSFCSTYGTPVKLDGVRQLELESLEIPQNWVTEAVIESLFWYVQKYIRSYMPDETVIVWFEYDINYYMCPISNERKERQYEQFHIYMTQFFLNILKERIKPNN